MIRPDALAIAALVAACAAKGSPLPAAPSPTFSIVIDDAFARDEQIAIAQGADAWSTAVGPDLIFSYVIAPRDQIDAALDRAPKPSTFFVVRAATSGALPASCLIDGTVGCIADGRVWLAVDSLNALPELLQRYPMHAIGHAMGLNHSPALTTVMASNFADIAATPSGSDVADYCQWHACSQRPAK